MDDRALASAAGIRRVGLELACRAPHLTARGRPVVAAGPIDAGPFRVRLLDKRADILTYLRFADVPMRTCFHSRRSRTDTIWVWKDPLSFCFHVEQRDGAPIGFVFGSSALADGAPAFVLNGLYLRTRDAGPRAAVLRAIEHALAPTGVRRIGIACEHGGAGPLPADYAPRRVVLERLRALRVGGAPVRYIYDDIDTLTNAPEPIDHLYWPIRP